MHCCCCLCDLHEKLSHSAGRHVAHAPVQTLAFYNSATCEGPLPQWLPCQRLFCRPIFFKQTLCQSAPQQSDLPERWCLSAGLGWSVLLSSEVARLQEEVGSLRGQVQGYEADVQQLIATRELGHANPKQKIQYHLRFSCCQDCLWFLLLVVAMP